MISARGSCAIHRCSHGRWAFASMRVGYEVRSVKIPALLDMSEDGRPGIEEVAALLLEHGGDEAGGLDRVGILATDHQAQALP